MPLFRFYDCPGTGSRGASGEWRAARALTLLAAAILPWGCSRDVRDIRRAHVASDLMTAVDQPLQPLEISWHGSFYMEGGQPESWMQQRLEKLYNVRLETSFLPAFSYDRLLTLRLMGGEIPDVYWLRDARLLKRAVLHGFALELPYEFIAKHAPDYVRFLARVAPDAWLISLSQNRNFGLPNLNIRQGNFPHPGVWNLTWLQRVGFSGVPETLEDMERALKLFHDADPDQDGVRDTFGYCPWKPGSSGGFASPGTLDRSFEEIFGAFGIAQNAWLLRDGGVVWGGTLPEAREALAVLRRWYAGGLIHPDYMTIPMGNYEVRKQFVSGRVGYVMGFNLGGWGAFDPRNRASISVQLAGVRPDEAIAPGRFPIGPRGHRGVRTWAGTIGGVMVFGPQVAREPEKAIRVLRLFNDAVREPELYRELRFGKRGLHWEWDDHLGIRKLPPFDTKAGGARELLGESSQMEPGDNHGYFLPFSCTPEEFETLTPRQARDFRETYMRPEWGIRDVLLAEDTVPSSAKYLPHLVELQAIYFTSIISGKMPLEAFDTFLARWHAEGGDLLTREANELHAQKQSIRDRVNALVSPLAHSEKARR